ncbi:MAG: right-handed parallel beta-helix repeat-containing protein, partial [Lentisphaeria bacterium]|nr:right-handed parallel beta-helix repeat-containing protein [Lentisphaeria bacterium]
MMHTRGSRTALVALLVVVLATGSLRAAAETGDEVTIQRQIDALPAAGGIVQLEARTYIVRASIVLRDNVTLEGAGVDATILRVPDAAATVKHSDETDAEWFQQLRVIRNQHFNERTHPEGNHDITVRDLSIDGNARHNPYVGEGIALANNYNYRIENVHVRNCRGYAGIITWPNHAAARRGVVRRNTIRNCIVEGNQMAQDRDATYGHGIYVTAPDNENVLISGCTTSNNAGSGIHLEDRVAHVFLRHNRSHDNGENGIFLAEAENCVLEFNAAYRNKVDGIHMSHGEGNRTNLVSGNDIHHNGRYGILVIRQYSPGRSNAIIIGNKFNDNDAGICLDVTAKNNFVMNNFIDDGLIVESVGNRLVNNYLEGKADVADGNEIVPWDDAKPWNHDNLVGTGSSGNQNAANDPRAPARNNAGDDVSIQKLIDGLPAGGGVVRLEAGVYNIRRSIVLRDHVTLQGAGMDATILRVPDGTATVKHSDATDEEWFQQLRVIRNERFNERTHPEGNHDITVRDL